MASLVLPFSFYYEWVNTEQRVKMKISNQIRVAVVTYVCLFDLKYNDILMYILYRYLSYFATIKTIKLAPDKLIYLKELPIISTSK